MRFRQRGAALVPALCLALATAAPATAGSSFAEFMIGADVSWIPEKEAEGKVFSDGGKRGDILAILKGHGFNWIRLRLFHDPRATNGYSAAGFCDLEHTQRMALRARQAGLRVLLDFHYSDNWADPGKQHITAAWKDLPFEALVRAVHDYTADVLRSLRRNGAAPDMVQIGNEIGNGILWPQGRSKDWDKLAPLLKAGIAGAKEASPTTPVMLHLAWGGQNGPSRWFLDEARRRGVEFDVLGQSYYPKWHGTTNDLRANLNDLAARYPQPVVVVEYSEFKREVNDIVRQVPGGRGVGTFIWEPTEWGEPLFDKNGNALPLLDLYPKLAAESRKPAPPAQQGAHGRRE